MEHYCYKRLQSRYVMDDCCPPQRQKSTGVTHQRRCIRRNSRKRRYCHDNCTCTLLVFLVCIEPLYYTVLNVTSYETLYDSIALQTNKQTNTDDYFAVTSSHNSNAEDAVQSVIRSECGRPVVTLNRCDDKLKEDLGKIGREGTRWKARGRSKRVIRQVLGG